MIFKQLSIPVRIIIRQIGAERVRVLPAPDGGVSGVHDHSRRVEMIGMNIVNLDRASGSGFSDYGYRNILQQNGFLTYQPVIG